MGEIAYDVDGNLTGRDMTVGEWADAQGVSPRTVKRWLAADQIPDAFRARNQVNGVMEWRIPEHATRQMNAAPARQTQPQDHSAAPVSLVQHAGGGSGQVVPFSPPEGLLEPSLREDLDDEPGYLDVATASRYLGIPQAQILRNPERFGLEDVGVSGSWRVPQRVIRRIMGY